jgi:hypothetical protein
MLPKLQRLCERPAHHRTPILDPQKTRLFILIESALDLVEQIRVVEVIIRIQLAEGMLREQHIRCGTIKRIPGSVVSTRSLVAFDFRSLTLGSNPS